MGLIGTRRWAHLRNPNADVEAIPPSTTLHVNYLTHNLSKLTDLTIISGAPDNDYTAWLNHTLALKRLCLWPVEYKQPNPWGFLKEETPLNLEHLYIEHAQVPPDTTGIEHLTRFSVLQTLIVGDCDGMGRIFSLLAREFSKGETATLHTFVVHQTSEHLDQPFNNQLDALLAVVPALKTLSITVHKTGRPSMRYICRNGATLRCLHVNHFADFHHYVVAPSVD